MHNNLCIILRLHEKYFKTNSGTVRTEGKGIFLNWYEWLIPKWIENNKW